MKCTGLCGILPLLLAGALMLLGPGCTRHDDRTGDVSAPRQREIVISAAASLKEALGEIAHEVERTDSTLHVTVNYGASNLLARQIDEGAPVDLFASAAEDVMDSLEKNRLIEPAMRKIFARNRLVVVGAAGADTIGSLEKLKEKRFGRIAIASPGVPARTYAEEALRAVGLWDGLNGRFVFGGNVRQVLEYVTSGEADAGLVYMSDAASAGSAAKVIYAVPDSLHRPITYPVAIITRSRDHVDAEKFLTVLTGPTGRTILVRRGFLPADGGR